MVGAHPTAECLLFRGEGALGEACAPPLSLSLSVCRSKGVVARYAHTGAGGPLASAPTVLSDYGVRAAARCVRTAQPPPFSCPKAESP